MRHGNAPGDPSSAPRCGARTRSGKECRAPRVRGRRRCRMHGGAPGSGAPIGNRNAFQHGLFTADAMAERRLLRRLLRRSRATLEQLKG
ncbi:MAG TPA: HGGxSTG domain-containing protein [Candidatus Dormibacteraeota bacterium]|nr:HGGxSTG domain-containing protein [Candidatus Dormibacteraeota bacterium]